MIATVALPAQKLEPNPNAAYVAKGSRRCAAEKDRPRAAKSGYDDEIIPALPQKTNRDDFTSFLAARARLCRPR